MKACWMILAVLMIFCSCSKEPGQGGTSALTGKIKIREYNNDFTILKGEYYAQEQDVYIIYGDDDIYSDHFATAPDGSFRFDYLRKGNYTLFVYSADSTGASSTGFSPVYISTDITENGTTVDLGEITILKTTKDGSGTSSVSGRIWCRDYNAGFTILLGQYYVPDQDVFLVYGNSQYYTDDCKTDVDGCYRFQHLPIGHYKVYSMSKDSTFTVPSGYAAAGKEFDITANEQHLVLDDIVILK